MLKSMIENVLKEIHGVKGNTCTDLEKHSL